MRNHGTDLAQRFGVMRERIEAMKAIWAEDEASYSGRYVSFERIWCWPKPLQEPHPPVLVGGNGRQVINRVVAYGDGWIPNEDEDLASRIAELQRAAAEAGRSRIPVTLSGSMRDPGELERLAQAGVDRLVCWLPAQGRDAVERAMDDYVAGRDAYQS